MLNRDINAQSRTELFDAGVSLCVLALLGKVFKGNVARFAHTRVETIPELRSLRLRYLAGPTSWQEFLIEHIDNEAQKHIERLGLDWNKVKALESDPGRDRKFMSLFAEALKGRKGFFAWFVLGVSMLSFLTEASEKSFLDISSSGKVDQEALNWRTCLRFAEVSIDERDRLEQRLQELRSASFPKIMEHHQRLEEALRDLAVKLDFKDGEHTTVEPRINANFYGTVNAPVNFGRVMGSIFATVNQLAVDPASQALADALTKLVQAIQQNIDLAPAKKTEALEAIEMLTEQVKLLPEQRKASVFSAALGYLPTILSSVVSGTKIWETFGPTIEGYFRS